MRLVEYHCADIVNAYSIISTAYPGFVALINDLIAVLIASFTYKLECRRINIFKILFIAVLR